MRRGRDLDMKEPSEWAAIMTSGTPPLVARNMRSQSPPPCLRGTGELLPLPLGTSRSE